MGRDIVVTGVLGAAAVLIIYIANRVIVLGHQYLRARGYEFEYARHTARAMLDDLEGTLTYGTVTIPRAATRRGPPWPELAHDGVLWDLDLEREGIALPEWAEPGADRVTLYGGASGSLGSDYGPPRGRGGWPDGDAGQGGPGSEPSGAPGPAPLQLPPGWSQEPLFPDFPDVPDDPATDETWARLMRAWGPEEARGDAETGPASQPMGSGLGREGEGATGTATRDREIGLWSPLRNTGRGGDRYYSTAAAPTRPPAAAAAGPGWAPTRLGTRFDAELAAQCSAWIREQNADVTGYLERLRSTR